MKIVKQKYENFYDAWVGDNEGERSKISKTAFLPTVFELQITDNGRMEIILVFEPADDGKLRIDSVCPPYFVRYEDEKQECINFLSALLSDWEYLFVVWKGEYWEVFSTMG